MEGKGGRWGGDLRRLAEKLADLLVHVTQEVHVRRSAAGALVLHQEVAEDQLVPVLLLHHHQLRGGERERGAESEGETLPVEKGADKVR